MKATDLELGHALGLFAGSGHQHADAAGRDRDARQRRSGGRLLGRLSVRRRRADPVPLLRLHDAEAEDRSARGRRAWSCLRSRCATRSMFGKTLGEVMSGFARRSADRRRAHARTATSRRPPTSSSPRTTSCSPSARARKCSSKRGRALGEAAPGRSSRIAAISIICACSRRGRLWSAGRSAISSCPARRQPSSSTFAAATPTCCRGPTSCSSSATASACSPTATTSRRCASSSATRSRAPPSSATSPSASAWRSASCSARSRSRCPASARSPWACRAC